MRAADITAMPRAKAKLMEVAVWNRGAPVKIQEDTMPPMLIEAKPTAMAVARR